ncbi:MAG: prepilin-type N-terminal cleavage/methylation domain-containing protein [Patescibacteria group bacterium]
MAKAFRIRCAAFGRKLGNFSAFTLAELIVVITILAVLATVGFLALS